MERNRNILNLRGKGKISCLIDPADRVIGIALDFIARHLSSASTVIPQKYKINLYFPHCVRIIQKTSRSDFTDMFQFDRDVISLV